MPHCEPRARENMTRTSKVAARLQRHMSYGESFNMPIPAKEICDVPTTDHSKTPPQEVCPALSKEAVCLGRSPTLSCIPPYHFQLYGCGHVLHPTGLPQRLG